LGTPFVFLPGKAFILVVAEKTPPTSKNVLAPNDQE
jgi:hypothetical protein